MRLLRIIKLVLQNYFFYNCWLLGEDFCTILTNCRRARCIIIRLWWCQIDLSRPRVIDQLLLTCFFVLWAAAGFAYVDIVFAHTSLIWVVRLSVNFLTELEIYYARWRSRNLLLRRHPKRSRNWWILKFTHWNANLLFDRITALLRVQRLTNEFSFEVRSVVRLSKVVKWLWSGAPALICQII